MDTRGRRGDQPPIRIRDAKPDETGVVEVVDLGPVERRRSSRSVRLGLLIVAGAAVLGAMALFPPGSKPTATPGPSAAAVAASPIPSSTPRATSRLTPTPTPPFFPPSFGPTPTPLPNAWVRSEVTIDRPMSPMGIWGVGDRFVGLATLDTGDYTNDAWVGLMSENGSDWQLTQVPPAIQDFLSWVMIGDRLWSFARVDGIAESTLQLVSTASGEEWDTLGAMADFGDATNGIAVLARIDGTWLASPWGIGESEGQVIRANLLRSTDGIHWSPVELPDAVPGMTFTMTYTIGETLALLGAVPQCCDGGGPMMEYTTTDGEHWNVADLPDALARSIGSIACSTSRCIATGYHEVVGVWLPQLYARQEAGDWTLLEVDPLPELNTLAAYPDGFVAMDSEPGWAWVSTDGTDWRRVQVMARDEASSVYALAINDRMVLGMTDSPAGGLAVWHGDLEALVH